MNKTANAFVVLLLALCQTGQAHRPVFSEKAATDPNTAVWISEPSVSQVIYRAISADARQVWLAFDANEGFELFIQIGVPALDRLKDFRPAMVVVGRGLPEGTADVDLPGESGAKCFPTDGVKNPRFFHEHFTGTDSWILRSETVVLPEAGRYYLVAFVPSGQEGKLWLSVGKKEVFTLADWSKFGQWKRTIRKFHEVVEDGRGPRNPVLSAIGGLLRSVGAMRPRAGRPDPEATPVRMQEGVKIHTVETECQNGRQEIRVLLPDSYSEGKSYRVLYVLPVEKGFDRKYGYGLGVLKKMEAHNRYDIIIVQMGFEKEPWFGDHATDPKTRQAGYLKEFVVPFIEERYSTPGTPEGRLLFGFSKSGWGALSLILKYPEFYGYAASWDAPMFLDRLHYRMADVYGTAERLNAWRPDLLVSRKKTYFQKKTRLVVTGERDWGKSIPTPNGGSHTSEIHTLLEDQGVKHVYDNSLNVPHRWDERWMAPTLKAMIELTEPVRAPRTASGPEKSTSKALSEIPPKMSTTTTLPPTTGRWSTTITCPSKPRRQRTRPTRLVRAYYLASTSTSTLTPCRSVLYTGEYSVSLLSLSRLFTSALTLNLMRMFV